MTRMRHFHLNINDSDNESDYAKLSKRKYVIGLVPFLFLYHEKSLCLSRQSLVSYCYSNKKIGGSMLDNLLKKNPVLGVIIYPLIGLGAIWLGHYYSQRLSLLEKTGGQIKINTFVYVAYQLGGTKLVIGFLILLALFFFYLGYTYLKKLGNAQK